MSEPTITFELTGEQSRALARAVRFYIGKNVRPHDTVVLVSVAEKVLVAIEEIKQQPLPDGIERE